MTVPTPNWFSGRIRPFSREFAEQMRALGDVIAWLIQIKPAIDKKLREPDHPAAASVTVVGTGTRVVKAPITGVSANLEPPWTYTVLIDGESKSVLNEYEASPYGHGQQLVFTQGTLKPFPVQGKATCYLVNDVWYFDHANPMNPTCSGGTP